MTHEAHTSLNSERKILQSKIHSEDKVAKRGKSIFSFYSIYKLVPTNHLRQRPFTLGKRGLLVGSIHSFSFGDYHFFAVSFCIIKYIPQSIVRYCILQVVCYDFLLNLVSLFYIILYMI